MKNIVKITIKGCSGYCSIDEAYDDKLVLTPSGIAYEYTPMTESEMNPRRKWSYKTNNPIFAIGFNKVAQMMDKILHPDEYIRCCDVGMIDFCVTFEDKTKEHCEYWCTGDEFEDCFKAIKELIPQTEYVPAVLLTSSDYNDEE